MFGTKFSDRYELPREDIDTLLFKNTSQKKAAVNPKQPVVKKIEVPEAEQVEMKELVHGLPLINEAFPVVLDEEEARIISETPTQNMFKMLSLN